MSDELYVWWAYFQDAFTAYLVDAEDFALGLIVAGIICLFLERIRPAEKNTKYFKKDFRKELGLAVLNALFFLPILTFLISISIIELLKNYVPYQMFDETLRHLPLALQILLGLLLVDFSTYWRHRFTHNYMWQYHSFHHSAEEITWITSLRLHPVDYAVAMLVDATFLYFLGFGGQGIAAALVIAQVYNYFTHLNMNVQFRKPLCYVLASPHYHRWHHATDKSAYDKNFCGIFSFLDVIFGTYHHPDELPKAYGLSPRDQKEVPAGLLAHLFQPVKKDVLKLFRKKSQKKS
jgi:sterol desaturase/sphingolipid hydroxylase (fatty acid hydroxylase superfamily)